jgi:hypothetical protein
MSGGQLKAVTLVRAYVAGWRLRRLKKQRAAAKRRQEELLAQRQLEVPPPRALSLSLSGLVASCL